jgi:hypothetical protein
MNTECMDVVKRLLVTILDPTQGLNCVDAIATPTLPHLKMSGHVPVRSESVVAVHTARR